MRSILAKLPLSSLIGLHSAPRTPSPPDTMNAIKIQGIPGAGGLLFISVSFFTAHLFADQRQVFEQSILPLLKEACLNCHSTAKQKGDLDLEASDIHKEPHIWENVLDHIAMARCRQRRRSS